VPDHFSKGTNLAWKGAATFLSMGFPLQWLSAGVIDATSIPGYAIYQHTPFLESGEKGFTPLPRIDSFP